MGVDVDAVIAPADPREARFQPILQIHQAHCEAETPIGSCHRLDAANLAAPEIRFYALTVGDDVRGMAAWKRLTADHGEVKSMHVLGAHRGARYADALLARVVADAMAAGIKRLSLETGAQPNFAPARAFYARHGFAICPPFGDYREDPNAVFMTKAL
ncbi:GNAT family N-acetyltransferase [Paracoccaceae bacterium GXU_MW_L88]